MLDLSRLVGTSLNGLEVVVWYELSLPTSETNSAVEGYFTDPNLAEVQGKEAGWNNMDGEVNAVYVLTDGNVGYLLANKSVALPDEDKLREVARSQILERLSEAEKALIGLPASNT